MATCWMVFLLKTIHRKTAGDWQFWHAQVLVRRWLLDVWTCSLESAHTSRRVMLEVWCCEAARRALLTTALAPHMVFGCCWLCTERLVPLTCAQTTCFRHVVCSCPFLLEVCRQFICTLCDYYFYYFLKLLFYYSFIYSALLSECMSVKATTLQEVRWKVSHLHVNVNDVTGC